MEAALIKLSESYAERHKSRWGEKGFYGTVRGQEMGTGGEHG